MLNRFTKKAEAVLQASKRNAEKLGSAYIGSEHLLLGILDTDCIGCKILEEKKLSYKDAYLKIYESSRVNDNKPSLESLTPKLKRIVELSNTIMKRFNGQLIGSEHLLYALCDEPDSIGARLLISLGISLQILKSEITNYLEAYMPKAEKQASSPVSMLTTYGKNLNAQAKLGKYDPLIGRDSEVSRLVQILSRRTKNNPCLIGEPGVGKTAIVEGLAQKINEGDVPSDLLGKTIISLDLSSMIAGAKYRGEFEERMRGVMNELRSNPSIILFIDEIHTIIGAGAAEGAVDAANIIKPALSRGQIQLIGATTTSEYRRHIEKDSALERRFQPVLIEEPSEEKTLDILFGLKSRYEDFHGVKISDDAIITAVSLSIRYLNDRFLPDKAIDLIDEGCSRLKMKHFSKTKEIKELEGRLKSLSSDKERAILNECFDAATQIKDEEIELKMKLKRRLSEHEKSKADSIPTLIGDDIRHLITQWTNIPITRLEKSESDRLSNLEEELNECVIGQRNAIKKVASSIKRSRMGLKNHKKPIGSFLFLGPTGVGKTELAKSISKIVFGQSDALIRIDMSEYMEKHSVSRLIGAPPGYVGYEEGGILTSLVRSKPYSVVLFDEIEKAHNDVYNILLQILEDGILTDSQGRHVDFKNTIIILTSNVGAKNITEPKPLGFSKSFSADDESDMMRIQINDALKNEFNPEFLNRLDEIIIFNKLSLEDAEKITRIMLNEVCSLARDIGIELKNDDSVIKHIAKKSYSKQYGARPIRRSITSLLENPLSEKILSGEISSGDEVSISFENDAIKFNVLTRK
ncbi:MAG: ATP-dependent Clp protease ATP-binding subunit [Clostridia bacterium]|nr:ATP-dependent Clp protease ATP-binding subunit [Clostridia bacterium]